MTAICLDQVSFAYDGRAVLVGLSLEMSGGERLALLGPNGSGKSTLLKLVSGILTPSAGVVLLGGRDPRGIPRRELARTIGMVPQELVVPFSFTVREIVELGRTPHLGRLGHSLAVDCRSVDEAVEVTGIAHLSKRIFNELSGGERRRVMIAMALAQEPEILLLDEPTQQLDISRQGEVLDLIFDLSVARRLTVIAAIHDLSLAARYFERVVMLHCASVAADGTPKNVLQPDFLEQVYGGPIEVRLSQEGAPPVVLPIPRSVALERKT